MIEGGLFILFGFYFVYWVAGMGVYIWRRNEEPIKGRGRVFSVFQMVVILCHFFTLVLTNSVVVPCSLPYFTNSFTFVLWSYPYFYRGAFYLWFNYHTHQERLIYGSDIEKSENSFFYRYQWLVSLRFLLTLHLVVCMIAALISVILFYESFGDWYNPYATNTSTVDYCFSSKASDFVICQIIVIIIFVFITIVKLWNTYDPYHIKTELKFMFVVAIIAFPLYAVSSFNLVPGFQPSQLLYGVYILAFFATVIFPTIMSFRVRKLKRTRSALSIDFKDTFNAVLQDPELLNLFEQFCVKRWCVEALLFYCQVQKYKHATINQRPDLAAMIQKQFLNDNSPSLINIDDPVRNTILRRLEAQDTPHDLFDEAERDVLQTIRYGAYEEWIKNNQVLREHLETIGGQISLMGPSSSTSPHLRDLVVHPNSSQDHELTDVNIDQNNQEENARQSPSRQDLLANNS